MKLKLEGMICTRYEVEQLAKENTDVTEVDFSDVNVYSASAMDEFLHSFPGAKMTGLTGWNAQEMEWVLDARKQIEERKNDTG